MPTDAYGSSQIGNFREENQDAIRSYVSEADSGFLYAVADGMGGYEHGGLAAILALETFVGTWSALYKGDPMGAMKRAMLDANLRVYQEAMRLNTRMGTTLTALHLDNGTLRVVHVGDSRAYLFRNGKPALLTNDHTPVGDMVRAKLLSQDKVRQHNNRSILNRCLGLESSVQPELSTHRIQRGDTLLLCSDGLWSSIEDEQLATLACSSDDVHEAVDHLIETALANGSDDNLSAWVIRIQDVSENFPARGRRWFGLPDLLSSRKGNATV